MQWVWVTFSKSYTSRCQRQDLYPNLPNIKAHALNHKSNCLTLTSLDFYQFTSKPHIIELGCRAKVYLKRKASKNESPYIVYSFLFCFVFETHIAYLHIKVCKKFCNKEIYLTLINLFEPGTHFFFLSDIPTNILRTLLPRISIQEVICRILTISSALI